MREVRPNVAPDPMPGLRSVACVQSGGRECGASAAAKEDAVCPMACDDILLCVQAQRTAPMATSDDAPPPSAPPYEREVALFVTVQNCTQQTIGKATLSVTLNGFVCSEDTSAPLLVPAADYPATRTGGRVCLDGAVVFDDAWTGIEPTATLLRQFCLAPGSTQFWLRYRRAVPDTRAVELPLVVELCMTFGAGGGCGCSGVGGGGKSSSDVCCRTAACKVKKCTDVCLDALCRGL